MKNKNGRKVNFFYFLIAFNFIIVILVLLYFIYLRFMPSWVLQYNGYGVPGENISQNLLNSTFEVDEKIKALKVKDSDQIYENLGKYYLDTKKERRINLDYPIFVNDSLAIYNLSAGSTLIANDYTENQGYSETIITSGTLYNSNNLKRADYYDYILMKNSDNLFINLKNINIKTNLNNYIIPMNSIINFTSNFITYYSLEKGDFIYHRIMDVGYESLVSIEEDKINTTYQKFLENIKVISKKREELKNEEKQEENKDIKEEIKDVKQENVEKESQTKTNQIIKKQEVQQPTEEEQLEKNDENLTKDNIENSTDNTQESIQENTNNTQNEVKWIKPTVICDDFKANTYSCKANVTINDPSRVIYKAVTFSFYIDDKIAFRVSTNKTGEVKATKMLPNTEYKIIGTYQYTNREGSILENTFYESKIKTKDTSNINTINLSITNGEKYSNKIELKDVHIESDIEDEALNGAKTAQIIIANTKYTISSSITRNLFSGKSIKYESMSVLDSNTKYDYEIKIFDTAGDEMKLKGNKGSTSTSKQAPKVQVKISNQDIIYVGIELNIDNKDEIKLNNYRYILYSSTGEVKAKSNLNENDKKLTFSDLNPQEIYTIKLFADFDLEDGKGNLINQEIGNATFSTMPISKLGTLKLNIDYDKDKDLSYNKIQLNMSINTDRTDSRLVQILKNVKLQITDIKGNVVEEIENLDVNNLSFEKGIDCEINNLNSNTIYYINVLATAAIGNVEENVGTTYTTTSFKTNKQPSSLNIKNVIVTTSFIDMDIYVDDLDNAVLDNIVKLTMADSKGKEYVPKIGDDSIKSVEKIPTNRWIRITYEKLKTDTEYTLICTSNSYNETDDTSKVKNNYEIKRQKFITSGLGGNIELKGLERQKTDEGANLIDIKSQNNWYSQVFDAIEKKYEVDEMQNISFITNSKYNYEKTNSEDGILKMLSNQCYVYDFSKYVGRTVTISFEAKVTDSVGQDSINIQRGMNIAKDINPITGITTSWKRYQKTLTIPNDGYLGFYLAKAQKDYYLEVKNLQVELGNEATEYKPYNYKLLAKINLNFIDKNHVTYNETTDNCNYYIRITANNQTQEFKYTYDDTETINEAYEYLIQEDEIQKNYKIELIIKQNDREYIIDTITFKYHRENCIEIKSISSLEEYKKIQPYGNYIILKNIDLTNANTESEYTFGSPSIAFYGSIDFNGKTIRKNTYEKTSYMFYKLEQTARLENVVIDYYINNLKNRYTLKVGGIDTNVAEEDGIYSLFLYNNAKIDNVRVNLKQCTNKQKINVALLGYRNSGTIENFIINMENILYASKSIAGLCLYSDGIIQNGYVYGEGIKTIGDIGIYDSRNIGGVLFQVDGAGLIQNVYNLCPITMEHTNMTFSYGANIVYNVGYPPNGTEITDSTASVKNVYSVQPIITNNNEHPYYGIIGADNKEENIGPNILNKYTNTTIMASRYFCDVNYDNTEYNTKASATSLYEPGAQEIMLNAEGYNQFIIDELVTNGYYPHLILNSCMPSQENIKIDITGTDLIDMLSAKKIKNNDAQNIEASEKVKENVQKYISENNIDLTYENIALTEFRIYNPAGVTITEINVEYLNSIIISQTYSKKISTVYVLLRELEQQKETDPITSYLDKYYIKSIAGKMSNGTERRTKYEEDGENGTRTIDVRFVKYISTAEEWNKINEDDSNGVSGLVQNYRLIKDIDFESAESSPYITEAFKGFLDGEYQGKIHTISNIQGSESLFKEVDGATIQNLEIKNISIDTSNRYTGLIESVNTYDNIKLDNICIKDMEVTSSYKESPYIGGICGYVYCPYESKATKLEIQNCSLTNLNIELSNSETTELVAGGIIGYIGTYGGVNTYITNNYVYGLTINGDVTSTNGVGGILGYKYHDTDLNRKPGTPYFYIQNCYTTGKINTKTKAGGILGFARWSTKNCFVEKCYSMINITSTSTSGSVYIGGIAGDHEAGADNIKNNLYAGNLYVTGNNVSDFNRILGNDKETSSYDNYAYKDQLISGEVLNTALGATNLLSYEQLFTKDTFSNLLKFNENWAYQITLNGKNFDVLEHRYFPQLNSTQGKILPNQRLITLDTDLKLDSITSVLSEDKTQATIKMKFENPNNLVFTRVKIQNDDMIIKEGTWRTYKENGLSVVEFVAIPKRAYDSYKIEYIYYLRDGNEEENEKDISTKIKASLFTKISNAEEWNFFFSKIYDEDTGEGSGRKYIGQNVKILGNIDFSKVDTIESEVTIGRLESDQDYTISNVNLKFTANNKAFISEIKTNMEKIKFYKCKITGRSYNGLIGIVRSPVKDCKFSDIDIDCKGYSYVGIISRTISGSFNNIKLNHITCSGVSYVGGLCGQTTSLGTSSDIIGEYIKITSTGTYAGGILGYTQGKITNIQAYQYSKDGKLEGDEETEYLVSGKQRAGGIIGQYNSSTITDLNTTNSKIIGTNYIGANIGSSSGNVTNMNSKNNIITATGDYVGGNVGYKSWYTYNNLKSENNIVIGNNSVGGNIGQIRGSPVNNAIAINNSVTGTNYVAGSIGRVSYANVITNIKVSGVNTQIIGVSYVGGILGGTTPDNNNSPAGCRIRNTKAEDATITGSGNYVGGIVGSNEYNTTSISATNNGNYSIAGAHTKNLKINGVNNVGGVSGYQNGFVYGAVSENNNIRGTGNNVGGILGYYVGYEGTSALALQSTNYMLTHSFCKDCEVIANNKNAGGLVGNFVYGTIQYCYVQNTKVNSMVSVAGGLVGYFDNKDLNDKQYKAYIKYNIIENIEEGKVISAPNSVGGLIGEVSKTLKYDEEVETYDNVECNLVVTDIESDGMYKDMGIGSVAGLTGGNMQSKYMRKIYVYNCSTINNKQVGGIKEIVEGYNLASSTQLQVVGTQSLYQKSDELNFGTTRYEYKTGYFPILKIKYSNAESYWGTATNYLNIEQQWLEIPKRAEEFDSNNLEPLNKHTMSLSNMKLMTLNTRSSAVNSLPKLYVYSVDVDKINIEFSNLEGGEYFSVSLEDGTIILEKQSISDRVYTLQYDFKTPFEIVLGNSSYWEKSIFEPKDVQNLLSINNDEYLYLSENEIFSNKRKIQGKFVNLYNNKALDENGNVYEISTMNLVGNNSKIFAIHKEIIPIQTAKYEGKDIQTFYHSSKVIEDEENSIYKDGQIFIKNGIMYYVDSKFDNVGDSIVIDSYNNNQYETILGKDGVLYDLLTEIKYPQGFKNENIIAMTNNMNNNDNIVLVYYSSGKVCGFNYVTGEKVYDNNIEEKKEDLIQFIVDNLNPNEVLYELNKSDYSVAQKLAKKLEKVSIDEAVSEFDQNIEIDVGSQQKNEEKNNKENTTNTITNNNAIESMNTSKDKYLTTYEPETKSYVVYSTKELLNMESSMVISENDKINKNEKLKQYYDNISEGKMEIINIGVTLIAITLIIISIILLFMYKKQNK